MVVVLWDRHLELAHFQRFETKWIELEVFGLLFMGCLTLEVDHDPRQWDCQGAPSLAAREGVRLRVLTPSTVCLHYSIADSLLTSRWWDHN